MTKLYTIRATHNKDTEGNPTGYLGEAVPMITNKILFKWVLSIEEAWEYSHLECILLCDLLKSLQPDFSYIPEEAN